jgi:hypothetical protein
VPDQTTPAGVLSSAEQCALEIVITIAGGAVEIFPDGRTARMIRSKRAAAVVLIRMQSPEV